MQYEFFKIKVANCWQFEIKPSQQYRQSSNWLESTRIWLFRENVEILLQLRAKNSINPPKYQKEKRRKMKEFQRFLLKTVSETMIKDEYH